MNIQCPKCKTINPPMECYHGDHYIEQCRQIVGQRQFLGLTFNVYCNHFLGFDTVDDFIKLSDDTVTGTKILPDISNLKMANQLPINSMPFNSI